MKYFYLLLGNLAALAIAGHFGINWLPLAAIVADFALWRHWAKHRP